MIHVIVLFELHDGKKDAFLEEFRQIVPTVQAESGCLEYGATVDVDTGIEMMEPVRANRVSIIERWASVAALKDHLAAPHMNEFRPRVKDYIANVQAFVTEPT